MSTRTPGDAGNNGDTTPEDVLATPPSTDDITPALKPAKSGRGGPPTMTYVLAAVVLVGAGFLAGTILNKGSDSNTSGFPGGALPSGFPGGALPSGFPGGATGADGGAGGGGITFGTVTKVEGDTVYVEQADGTTITVKTNGSTTVQVSTTGTVSDLSPGSTVVVQGSSSGDDTVTAQTITEGGLAGAGAGNTP